MRVVWTNVQMYYFIGHVYVAMYGEIDPDPHLRICDPSLSKMLIIIFDGFSCSRTLPHCFIHIRLLLGFRLWESRKIGHIFWHVRFAHGFGILASAESLTGLPAMFANVGFDSGHSAEGLSEGLVESRTFFLWGDGANCHHTVPCKMSFKEPPYNINQWE